MFSEIFMREASYNLWPYTLLQRQFISISTLMTPSPVNIPKGSSSVCYTLSFNDKTKVYHFCIIVPGAKAQLCYPMKNVYYPAVFPLFSTAFPGPAMYRAFNTYLLNE